MFGLPFAHSSAPIAQTASLGDCYIIKHCELVMDISDHSQLLGLVIHQVTRICNGHYNASHSWRMPIPHKPVIQTIDLPSSLATSPHFCIVELLSIPSHLQSFTPKVSQFTVQLKVVPRNGGNCCGTTTCLCATTTRTPQGRWLSLHPLPFRSSQFGFPGMEFTSRSNCADVARRRRFPVAGG